MEQRHRDLIVANISKLIECTDLEPLLSKLQEKKVFPDILLQNYRNKEKSLSERTQHMYIDIQKRGPKAFNNLLNALNETGHEKLALLLRDGTNAATTVSSVDGLNCTEQAPDNVDEVYGRRTRPYVLPTNTACQTIDAERLQNISERLPYNINLNEQPLLVNVKKELKLYDSPSLNEITSYPMSSKKRGALLVINNVQFSNNPEKYRRGADIDHHNIIDLFKQCGFRNIRDYKNLKYKEMQERIADFAKDHEMLRSVDCCVVCIMSHGDEGHTTDSTRITTSDGYDIDTSLIVQNFSSAFCPVLQNVPKIFIFQTCRGPIHDYGSPRYRTQSDGGDVSNRRVRNNADTLIAHSTVPGYASHRDIKLGTWYIQTLCEVFMNHAYNTHIEDLLKLVDNKLADLVSEDGSMQTSSYVNYGFSRHCFLHPGIFRNEDGNPEYLPVENTKSDENNGR